MENKFWKGVLVGAMVTALMGLVVVGISSGILMLGQRLMDNQMVVQSETSVTNEGAANGEDPQSFDMQEISGKLNLLQQYVEKLYLFEEDISDMEQGVYAGFMQGLGDPYSVYYTEDEFKKMMEDTTGVYCGIGVMVSQDRTTGLTTVVKVFKDTPGFRAGLLPGDILYKVGETLVASEDLDIIINNYIKGEAGTPVTITVYRVDKDEYVDMTMNRENIQVTTVESEMMEGKVGYVEVSQFDELTASQFETAIDQLEEQGMEKLVIDLRNNPGGVLDGVVEMLAYILPEGKIVYTADKNGNGIMYATEKGYLVEKDYPENSDGRVKKVMKDDHQVDLPMVVLVNGNSASASEVFTGAIKDYEWGTVVGTTTYGKGIVQSLYELGDGTAIKLTVSHYFTPNGMDIHKKGIEPDVTVELGEQARNQVDIPFEVDNQLQEALKVLNK